MINIVQADISHLEELSMLFDNYRVFYKQPSDLASASKFLLERLEKNESVIFLAYYHGKPAGFTQLYPVFSSVSLQSMYILNDLFVDEAFRRKSIGKLLLDKAKVLVKENNFKGLYLETAKDNPAQALYEREGWEKDEFFFHYFWKNK